MSDITRIDSNQRMSRVVIHNGVVYLAGLTANNTSGNVAEQTREVLEKIDHFLAKADTDKSRLLTAQIWLRDLDRDFESMNEVWSAWADQANMPTRATCEARLATPEILVEIIVSAAAKG